jgi:hypothetical protein
MLGVIADAICWRCPIREEDNDHSIEMENGTKDEQGLCGQVHDMRCWDLNMWRVVVLRQNQKNVTVNHKILAVKFNVEKSQFVDCLI